MRRSAHRVVTPLFPGASVTCQDLGTCAFEHLCVLNRLLRRWEHTELGGDRDGEILVQIVD